MNIKKECVLLLVFLFSASLFSQDSESFDITENVNYKQESEYKTYFDCFKSKKLHLKKTSNSYNIQIPYEGKHTITVTDAYGKVLSSFITTDKEEWHDINNSLPTGTYVIKLKTPDMALFKFVVVI